MARLSILFLVLVVLGAAFAGEAVEQRVDGLIRQNAVLVFSKSYCPYCRRAKAMLADLAAEKMTVLELDQMGAEGSEIQAYLLKKTGQRTVPNVFIGGKHIGGSDAVSTLMAKGELASMVQAAISADKEL